MSTKAPSTERHLEQLVSLSTLKLLAGGHVFRRGERYHADGLVNSLLVGKKEASALVRGSKTYRCKLKASGQSFLGECTCPAFEDAGFCKHLVAVGLAIIEPAEAHEVEEKDVRDEVRPRPKPRRKGSRNRSAEVTYEDIEEHLSGLAREKLVGLVLSQAGTDGAFLRALKLEILANRAFEAGAKRDSNPEALIDAIKRAIDEGVDIDKWGNDWPDEYETANRLDDLIKQTEELLHAGRAAEVVELSEYFIAAVEPTIERFEEGGRLLSILEKLQSIHLSACEKARPEPVKLAEKLFRWELSSSWSVFENAPVKYKTVFGDKGLRAYQKQAKVEWQKIPPVNAKERNRDFDSRRFRITGLMERLAKTVGGVEAEAAVLARDLSSAWNYLKIAELYARHKMPGKAVEWAEKGLKAFPERPDGRLREFLAKEYHRMKRPDDAMALIWSEFADLPSLQNFKTLKTHADLLSAWPAWRRKGIEHLEAALRKSKQLGARIAKFTWEEPRFSSTLIEIYLWEKDLDAAWQQAKREGADIALWHQLATAREKTHPEDAASAYMMVVVDEINRGGNESYREAVKYVVKIEALMKRAKKYGDFPSYLEELRTGYRSKRNFIKLLDAKFEAS